MTITPGARHLTQSVVTEARALIRHHEGSLAPLVLADFDEGLLRQPTRRARRLWAFRYLDLYRGR